MYRLLSSAAALAIVALAAGCGGADPDAGSTIDRPNGPAEIVLRIDEGGGFVPVDVALTQLPPFTLYGDGQVITPAPMIEIYPPPAVPGLQQTTVSEAAVDRILSRADDLSLLDAGREVGQPPIADASTTTFIVNARGEHFETSVYALGFEDPSFREGTPDLTEEHLETREALHEFRMDLVALTPFTRDEQIEWQPYEPRATMVFIRPAGPEADGGEITPNTLPWPLADLGSLGKEVEAGFRRVVVSGEELERLKPLLAEATTITRWESGGETYELAFRPLLPDES